MICGSEDHHEITLTAAPKRRGRRRKCKHQECGKPVTHVGRANGLVMTGGCDWHVQRWKRDVLARRRGQS